MTSRATQLIASLHIGTTSKFLASHSYSYPTTLNPEHATDQVSLHLKLCRKRLGNVEAVATLNADFEW
jgi:hypothetical protein